MSGVDVERLYGDYESFRNMAEVAGFDPPRFPIWLGQQPDGYLRHHGVRDDLSVSAAILWVGARARRMRRYDWV